METIMQDLTLIGIDLGTPSPTPSASVDVSYAASSAIPSTTRRQ
jgi:hypothetical protein